MPSLSLNTDKISSSGTIATLFNNATFPIYYTVGVRKFAVPSKPNIVNRQHKVDYKIGRNNLLTIMDFLPNANNLQLTETGMREIIGRLFYLGKSYFVK